MQARPRVYAFIIPATVAQLAGDSRTKGGLTSYRISNACALAVGARSSIEMATQNLQGSDSGAISLLNGVLYEKNQQNPIKNGYKNGYTQHCTNGHVKENKQYQKLSKPASAKMSTPCREHGKESFEPPPLVAACLTYLGFFILMFLGYINQLFFVPKVAQEQHRDGYPPLYDRFSSFYSRYVYRRVRDCWNKPICSVPGAHVTLKDRITKDNGWTFEFTGTETPCLNLGSYNYLGFAESSGTCAQSAIESIENYGLTFCSTRSEYGTCPLHIELEELTARFLGVEAVITCGMGFATNTLNIPTLLSPGCLVLSDEKNHASIILGLRLSGATIRVFKHNDMKDLEKVLQQAILKGQPGPKHTHWKKILIFVEGVYSMEGTIVNLPKVIELKKKYKAYLYLDEAHSIGAVGPQGRGVVDYYGCDPKDIDILMGTFTKSFGSAGGYVAGSKKIINFLRKNSHAELYASSMSPPVTAQIIAVMKIIMGEAGDGEGKRRIDQLARNTRYFRRKLNQMGVITYGNEDSPVVPILVYLFSKIGAVVRTLQSRKIATVGVGFPATPLLLGRIRICLSAAHTKQELDYALNTINEIADEIGLKYSRKPRDPNPIIYENIQVPQFNQMQSIYS